MKKELNKRKVNKRTELIEKVLKISNDLDQEVTQNRADSQT